jgi:putative phage-type endonuclease
MKHHNLEQGSAAWHAHRRNHFNASDAPAMMNCSPYKSRADLIHETATGLTPEVDVATQRRFDSGHRFEALARPLAEQIVGDDLYPVVGTEGRFSASFDGLTMDESVAFEHKSINDSLRAAIRQQGGNANDFLPDHYKVQLEHQAMVAGAVDRILFMASNWSADGTLLEERHCWYYPDQALRERIVAGWAQFEADVAAYVPAEATAPAPVGRTMEALPALRIEVTGQVTASNLAQYREHALEVLGKINRNLSTDQDFADAEKTVKWCADVEERLAAAKQHALSQTESIDALFRTIDDISAEARRVRLDLDKLVKARKEALRGEIVSEGAQALRAHITALNDRLGKPLMPTVLADFIGAIKGKKNLDSMRDAVSAELARAKIEASATADRIDANLKTIAAAGHDFLFADLPALVLKAPDDLALVVKSRVDAHAAAEAEKAAKAAAAAPAPAEPPAPAPAAVVRLSPRAPAATTSAPTLKLGEICTRLGFTVTADFLTGLGYAPAATDRASKLYHEQDFAHICAALVAHIESLQAKAAA